MAKHFAGQAGPAFPAGGLYSDFFLASYLWTSLEGTGLIKV